MKNLVVFCVISLCILILSNCAAIFNDNPEKIRLTSEDGADLFVDGRKVGTSFATVELSIKQSHNVSAKKGDKEGSIQIVNKIGLGWVILDLLFGFWPVVIDLVTGSWYELHPSGEVYIPIN